METAQWGKGLVSKKTSTGEEIHPRISPIGDQSMETAQCGKRLISKKTSNGERIHPRISPIGITETTDGTTGGHGGRKKIQRF